MSTATLDTWNRPVSETVFRTASYERTTSENTGTNLLLDLNPYSLNLSILPEFSITFLSRGQGYYLPKYALLPADVKKRLTALATLGKGWDGEGSLPIDHKAIDETSDVLTNLHGSAFPFKAPHIVPTFLGQIQIEWHSEKRSLEFEYTPNGWAVLGVDQANTEEPTYFDESVDLNNVAYLGKLYTWFAEAELVWPSQ